MGVGMGGVLDVQTPPKLKVKQFLMLGKIKNST